MRRSGNPPLNLNDGKESGSDLLTICSENYLGRGKWLGASCDLASLGSGKQSGGDTLLQWEMEYEHESVKRKVKSFIMNKL
jgi:hypothetical protein